MNEIRRARLEQVGMALVATEEQLSILLAAESQDLHDLPDNIEHSDFAARVLKQPMFELCSARINLAEAIRHIKTATAGE